MQPFPFWQDLPQCVACAAAPLTALEQDALHAAVQQAYWAKNAFWAQVVTAGAALWLLGYTHLATQATRAQVGELLWQSQLARTRVEKESGIAAANLRAFLISRFTMPEHVPELSSRNAADQYCLQQYQNALRGDGEPGSQLTVHALEERGATLAAGIDGTECRRMWQEVFDALLRAEEMGRRSLNAQNPIEQFEIGLLLTAVTRLSDAVGELRDTLQRKSRPVAPAPQPRSRLIRAWRVIRYDDERGARSTDAR